MFGGLFVVLASIMSDVQSEFAEFSESEAVEALNSLAANPTNPTDSTDSSAGFDAEADKQKVLDLLKACCCSKQCFKHYELPDILENRRQYWHLSQENRRRVLAPVVKSKHPELNGATVCQAFVRLYFGCGKKVIENVKKMLTPERKPAERDFVKEARVCDELDRLADYGEQQPDRKEVHLSFPTRKAVYESLPESFRNCVSLSYFCRCWRQRRSHIKLRRVMRYVTWCVMQLVVLLFWLLSFQFRQVRHLCAHSCGDGSHKGFHKNRSPQERASGPFCSRA